MDSLEQPSELINVPSISTPNVAWDVSCARPCPCKTCPNYGSKNGCACGVPYYLTKKA